MLKRLAMIDQCSFFRLTLNTLIDQSSSTLSLPVLDDRNPDVTNFLLTLERILSFRMRGNADDRPFLMTGFPLANWLSDRRYFWDFIRPACIGSCQQSSRMEAEIFTCHWILFSYRACGRSIQKSKPERKSNDPPARRSLLLLTVRVGSRLDEIRSDGKETL